ncbi:MAG: hypothetical protein GXO10_07230 [Crenarchaeota archaeon]|nr:hypothetical protein [Thermoproteota archaeon]
MRKKTIPIAVSIAVVIIVIAIALVYLYHGSTSGSVYTSHGPTGRSFVNVGSNVAQYCSNIGNMSIGQTIRWLFDHHSEFRFIRYEFPSNLTIVWVIAAPSHSMLSILVSHIEQMECVIEHGGNPRPWDPVFRVDSYITRRFVKTRIVWLNSTAIKVIKVAKNRCAYEVIKLHAEIVEGFFKTGRIEAQKIHEIPSYVLKICKPYLNATSS